jgi:RND superfamily putative drug exporter
MPQVNGISRKVTRITRSTPGLRPVSAIAVKPSPIAKIARWCFRHRFIVVGIWLVVLVSVSIGAKIIGSDFSNSFSLPGTDSTKALNLLQAVSQSASGETDTIVWQVSSGSVRSASVENHINAMLSNVATIPQVASITSPYTPFGVTQISRDGRTAFAQVHFSQQFQNLDKTNVKSVISTVKSANLSGLEVEVGGQAIEQSQQVSTSVSEGIGIAAAAIVLFIAFGSLLGISAPLVTALIALGVGISSISLLSHVISMSQISPILGALIGLGVGIDYALFIITRYRAGLLGGLVPEEAAVKALDTAGRAVIFAGGTVCVALLGLLTMQISFLDGVGIAAAIIVLVAVLAAITLLPALMGIYKMRIMSRRTRRELARLGKIESTARSSFWARNARSVERHPIAVGVMALIILGVLMVPYFSLRLGSSDAGNDPANTTTRKAYDLLAGGFGPGFNGPLQLVGEVKTPLEKVAFANLASTVQHMPGVSEAAAFPIAPGATLGIIQVVPTTSPESVATATLIANLRKNVIPHAEQYTNLHVYVGGITAIFADFAGVIGGKLPLFLAVIIGFGFIILMMAFRSLVIPLTAAVMNLLAAGAAFGVIVAVFQWGWLSNVLHTGGPGPVEAFLPVIMLAILFGLSMDYQVFLVSRMHEEWVHSKDNDHAVRIGQTETGRVITAAATIMIFVFGSFVLGGQRVTEEFGIGLAAAVLLDAFIIRNYLVPAIMHSLGNKNWYLPAWLDHILPKLSVEPNEVNVKNN